MSSKPVPEWAFPKVKLYFVSKDNRALMFWYGLKSGLEYTSDEIIDVRELPEKYHHPDITVALGYKGKSAREFARRLNRQRVAHSLTFDAAFSDGYDFEKHILDRQTVEHDFATLH